MSRSDAEPDVALGDRRRARTLRPRDRGELVAAVGDLARAGQPFAAIGKGSRLDHGAPFGPVDAWLSTSGLTRITRFAPDDLTCGVEPGVQVADLLAELRAKRLALAPGPIAGDRTIGGLLAEAPPTSRGFDRADWRSQLIGVRAVDALGRELKAGGNVVKNVAGYDLCKLFVGSGGAFFVAVELQLRLVARPAASSWLQSPPLGRAEAVRLWLDLRRRQADLAALDLELVEDGSARVEALATGPAALVTALEKAIALPVVAGGSEAFDRPPFAAPPAEVTARGHVAASRVAAFAAALPAGFQARIHLQGAFTMHGPALPALPDGVRLRPLRGAEAAPAPVPALTRRLKDTFGAALAPQRASFDTRLCNDHR